MKRKIELLGVTVGMLLLLTACVAHKVSPDQLPNPENAPPEVTATPTPEAKPTPTPEPTPTPTPTPEPTEEPENRIPVPEGATVLTQEQIEEVQDAFEPLLYDEEGYLQGVNLLSCFFTSWYSSPEQLDIAEFLRYCPLAGGHVTEEEFDALKALENWRADDVEDLEDFNLPIHKYPASAVEATLQKYMGISLQELDFVDAIYLEEYDAFYNTTSDFAAGTFICRFGIMEGDEVRLYSDATYPTTCLTLRKLEDRYVIESRRRLDEQGNPPSALWELMWGTTLLSEEELADYEALLCDISPHNWYNQALCFTFNSAADVNLYELFHNGGASGRGDLTEEEKAYLESLGMPMEMDMARIPREEMERVLLDYFRVTLDNCNQVGLDRLVYFADTDCYYRVSNDFMAAEQVEIQAAGRRSGGAVDVYYSLPYMKGLFRIRLYGEPRDGECRIMSNVQVTQE